MKTKILFYIIVIIILIIYFYSSKKENFDTTGKVSNKFNSNTMPSSQPASQPSSQSARAGDSPPKMEFQVAIDNAFSSNKIDTNTYDTLGKLSYSQKVEIQKKTSTLDNTEMVSALQHISTTLNSDPGNLESAFKSAISDINAYLKSKNELIEEEQNNPTPAPSPGPPPGPPSGPPGPPPGPPSGPPPGPPSGPPPGPPSSPTTAPSSPPIAPSSTPPPGTNCPELPEKQKVLISFKNNTQKLACINTHSQQKIQDINKGQIGYYKNILVTTQNNDDNKYSEWELEPRQGLSGKYKIKNKYYQRYLGYGKIYECDKDKNILDNSYQKLTDTGRASRIDCPDKSFSFTPLIHTASHTSLINQNYKNYTWTIKCENNNGVINYALIPDYEGDEHYLTANNLSKSNPLFCQQINSGDEPKYEWKIQPA